NAQDADILERGKDNERFLLTTDWFHTVKVGKDVLDLAHPLHALFPDRNAPHLIVLSSDGSLMLPIRKAGEKACEALDRVLAQAYEKPSEPAARRLVRMLSEFDALDDRQQALDQQAKVKAKRQKTQRLDLLEQELRALEEERQRLFAEEKELRDL